MPYKIQQVKPQGGFYAKTKVYYDGSHYIAIPHTERPYKPRKKPVDEIIIVKANAPPAEEVDDSELDVEREISEQENSVPEEKADTFIGVQNEDCPQNMVELTQKLEIKITKKQLFEEIYKKYLFLKRRERREKIIEAMRPYFINNERTALYVDTNLDRKRRNLIARRIRLTRKANLQNFNYFVTFTYDSALHTEDSFKKNSKTRLVISVPVKVGDI